MKKYLTKIGFKKTNTHFATIMNRPEGDLIVFTEFCYFK